MFKVTAVVDHGRKAQVIPACAWFGATGLNPLKRSQKLTTNSNRAIGESKM